MSIKHRWGNGRDEWVPRKYPVGARIRVTQRGTGFDDAVGVVTVAWNYLTDGYYYTEVVVESPPSIKGRKFNWGHLLTELVETSNEWGEVCP